ncbi:MAG TPA: TSUP family transporter [Puia sp.]|uniref:TSUP family transporter n=1 Tax=Puia sp. TaxID=2045100 RepID=UPI002D0233EF|nr:TSUP family transporter [Puia sp.]HVU96584.1 TSUP family transporter [Puia sp.]
MSEVIIDRGNTLFPVFVKLEQLRLLIVGGGKVGLEKLQAVLQNSPSTSITVVAPDISAAVRDLAARHSNILLLERPYHRCDLESADIAIVAVNDRSVSETIARDAKEAGILVNVADTPDLCDFYLSSVIRKGNLKIAISTNGKSPTIAKRLKEELGGMIPDEMESVLNNMQTIRQQLNGDFPEKVRKLNELTKVLVAKQATPAITPRQKSWQQVVKWCLFAFCFMIIGHGILSYIPFGGLIEFFRRLPERFDVNGFLIMALAGFLAQMVDGSMGLGYGTISTTFLLAYGVPPAIVSSRVHSARVFSSGVSGYSHHRFGNINKKLFRAIVVPGIIGAVLGATMAYFGQTYTKYVRVPLSMYTIYLGYYILRKAFARRNPKDKVRQAGWLASVGGFTDAFAGGGWGTLVTSTLISKRRNPRYVIGSVCLAEFFVVLASSITFFILLESIPLLDVAGMILGGIIAAPIAARLAGKLPVKTMFIAVGALVILTSCNTLWKAILQVLHN